MMGEIYINEKIWLESLGCKFEEKENNIFVVRDDLLIDDFNFLIPLSIESISKIKKENLTKVKAIKVRESLGILCPALEHLKSIDIEISKLSSDIQMVAISKMIKLINFIKISDVASLRRASPEAWCSIYDQNRFFSDCIVPYDIVYADHVCGRVCLVKTEQTIGIYDLEIYPQYRNKGIGYSLLTSLVKPIQGKAETMFFIQTWEENESAYRLYLKSGFKLVDRCFVYSTRSKTDGKQ